MALQKLLYTDGVTVIPASNLNDIQDAIIALESEPALVIDSALSDTSTNPVQNKVITGAIADTNSEVDELKSDINTLSLGIDAVESFVVERVSITLPDTLKGTYEITFPAPGGKVICGTQNAAELLNVKPITVTINGITITATKDTITAEGTCTSGFNYSLADGTAKLASELMAMTLPVPVHLYTLSSKVTGGTISLYPALAVRSKTSGNAVTTQNNTAVFTMDTASCGGLYIPFAANKAYSFTYKIALIPFRTTNASPYREQDSSVEVIEQTGVYVLDGYAWKTGDSQIAELKSRIPKRPKCVYSTRVVPYSLMTECLDVYIPAKTGYVDYIFGHTVNSAPASEGGGNVWRLVQIDAVSDALAYRFHVTQQGETAMALGIAGRDDFIGGTYHGDEVMRADSLLFLLDGKPVDITSVTEITDFTTLSCVLVSDLYDPNDHSTLVGVHGCEWRFDESGMFLGQTIEFAANLTLNNTYAPMVCALRGNDTASALQITDTYFDDGSYQKYDVSEGGFVTYPNQLKSDVRYVNLSGEASGAEIVLEIIEQPEGMNGEGVFLYNGVNTYNKIYCCLGGYGNVSSTYNTVSSGDKWKIKSKVRVNIG